RWPRWSPCPWCPRCERNERADEDRRGDGATPASGRASSRLAVAADARNRCARTRRRALRRRSSSRIHHKEHKEDIRFRQPNVFYLLSSRFFVSFVANVLSLHWHTNLFQ